MLVRTPAIKLGVEIRDAKTEDGFLILSGAANAMPCTVEMSGKELWFYRIHHPTMGTDS